jgi:hypothetical protein
LPTDISVWRTRQLKELWIKNVANNVLLGRRCYNTFRRLLLVQIGQLTFLLWLVVCIFFSSLSLFTFSSR